MRLPDSDCETIRAPAGSGIWPSAMPSGDGASIPASSGARPEARGARLVDKCAHHGHKGDEQQAEIDGDEAHQLPAHLLDRRVQRFFLFVVECRPRHGDQYPDARCATLIAKTLPERTGAGSAAPPSARSRAGGRRRAARPVADPEARRRFFAQPRPGADPPGRGHSERQARRRPRPQAEARRHDRGQSCRSLSPRNHRARISRSTFSTRIPSSSSSTSRSGWSSILAPATGPARWSMR